MKLIPDKEVECWLSNFEPALENFDWDDGNKYKNLKHGVSWEDAQSLFFEDIVFEGKVTEPKHLEPRYLILGCDWSGRFLALIFTLRNERLRPISCRLMRKKERERYEECT